MPYPIQFSIADDHKFWFDNSMHFPEPMSPFDWVNGGIGVLRAWRGQHPGALSADHAWHRSPKHQWPGVHRRNAVTA